MRARTIRREDLPAFGIYMSGATGAFLVAAGAPTWNGLTILGALFMFAAFSIAFGSWLGEQLRNAQPAPPEQDLNRRDREEGFTWCDCRVCRRRKARLN